MEITTYQSKIVIIFVGLPISGKVKILSLFFLSFFPSLPLSFLQFSSILPLLLLLFCSPLLLFLPLSSPSLLSIFHCRPFPYHRLSSFSLLKIFKCFILNKIERYLSWLGYNVRKFCTSSYKQPKELRQGYNSPCRNSYNGDADNAVKESLKELIEFLRNDGDVRKFEFVPEN